jgi:hypothetical protein
VNKLGCCKILLRVAKLDGFFLAYIYNRNDREEIGCEDVDQIHWFRIRSSCRIL